MLQYRMIVKYTKTALKQLKLIPGKTSKNIRSKIEQYAQNRTNNSRW